MNVKEQHVVTGMSRDSSVAQHNPNLVYDARNIRITTKDGKNSLLSVTNERGTKVMEVTGNQMTGIPIGSAALGQYIVIFTHLQNPEVGVSPDHIYRCTIYNDGTPADVTTIFSGTANFHENYPIETLPVYETESIQKVYWVDGRNQPRMINIVTESTITDVDLLNFSREVELLHTFSVTKYSTGGEFPVGTIQYAFSYFTKFGQESRLVDIGPMYYLSPQETGLDATEIANCSFEITINRPDHKFDFVRLYSIIRTTANAAPQCRIVEDFAINKDVVVGDTDDVVVITDNGIKGKTYNATSMYFIGGEELIANTLAQKDNTLFLGNIKINRPNASNVVLDSEGGTAHTIRYYVNGYADGSINQSTFGNAVGNIVGDNMGYSPDDNRVPTLATKYYDYNQNNNRSSYYIKRFKYLETYRLGFIAQYKNGQWSEPVWVGDFANNYTPDVGAGRYRTGCFHLNMPQNIITKLMDAGFKRIAPVVVYPQVHERTTVMQGLLCPSMYNKKDRDDNSPYAQSSWFFRMFQGIDPNGEGGSYYWHGAPIGGSDTIRGEIQCIDTSSEGMYRMDGNIVTFHSPDIECVDVSQNTDLEGVGLRIVGFASVSTDLSNYPYDLSKVARVVDRFIETENVGIDTEASQVIPMKNVGYPYYSMNDYCHPLYFDRFINNSKEDEVVKLSALWDWSQSLPVVVQNPSAAFITYPWHRSGSLNNQQALTAKQKAEGFNTRTAMLKRNITANAWFANSKYFNPVGQSAPNVRTASDIYKPKIFNADQLAGVKVASGDDAFVYYGNIDKILTSDTGKYKIYAGWLANIENLDLTTIVTKSENAWKTIIDGGDSRWIAFGYNDGDNDKVLTGTDPVSMKYKSSPHIVLKFKKDANSNVLHVPMHAKDNTNLAFTNSGSAGSGLWIAELVRSVDANTRFGGKTEQAFMANDWIRCGNSVRLDTWYHATSYLDYQQGDCYIQRYDCLKTYPFTNEDINSVIETMSTTLETYVNLDFRYDSNRGSGRNIVLSPQNFNLYNHLAYEQVNNFFTYHGLDFDRFSDNEFPSTITWSLEKHLGEDIDTWASIDGNNTIELDGAFGKVNKLINYNNDIYCFQNIGFSQLLFNSRVQIPTSDSTPIEITNGMKMDGKRYISTKIGCTNKWSIIETPMGLYFIDDILRTTYLFNGQLSDLSTNKGMKSWMNSSCAQATWNPKSFSNCRAFYDKVGKDVYWVYKDIALVYSEVLGQYMSFMDYGSVPLIENAGNSTFATISLDATPETFNIPIKNSSEVDGSICLTVKSAPAYISLSVHVVEPTDQDTYPPVRVTSRIRGIIQLNVTIYVANTSEQEESYAKYTLNEILTALRDTAVDRFFDLTLVDLTGSDTIYTSDQEAVDYTVTHGFNPIRLQSPFWELGTGEYNMFFGEFKPYWLTLISNSYPTANKIYNTLAWRDIVQDVSESTPVTKPFHTFDHLRVWTENQDTQPVVFNNSLSENPSRQPISYDAAISNLRKKFNVWRCQIPRDKIATNTARARISNPWCYIKLSREDFHIERHEIMDFEVNYFM